MTNADIARDGSRLTVRNTMVDASSSAIQVRDTTASIGKVAPPWGEARMPCVEALFLDHLIARAERTLADHKTTGALSRDALWLFEGLVSEMYEERRLALEAMMRQPFQPAR